MLLLRTKGGEIIFLKKDLGSSLEPQTHVKLLSPQPLHHQDDGESSFHKIISSSLRSHHKAGLICQFRVPWWFLWARPRLRRSQPDLSPPISCRSTDIFGIFWPEKNETREPWEKTFYCCKRVLLVGFPPQKISKKLFWRPISPHAGCREVVSGTVRSVPYTASDPAFPEKDVQEDLQTFLTRNDRPEPGARRESNSVLNRVHWEVVLCSECIRHQGVNETDAFVVALPKSVSRSSSSSTKPGKRDSGSPETVRNSHSRRQSGLPLPPRRAVTVGDQRRPTTVWPDRP